MLHITSYCDESIRPDTGVLVIAGYVTTRKQWNRFGQLWRDILRECGLREFKARDCEHGKGAFEGWSREERKQCCESLVSTILDSPLVAVAMIVNLQAYQSVRPEIDTLRTRPMGKGNNVVKFGDPFYLAFQYQIEELITLAQSAPPEEKVIFIFDETTEYGGKSQMLFREMKEREPFRQRMATITFVPSEDYSGLQAADLLAYEVRRYAEEVAYIDIPKPERWQWERLTHERKVVIRQCDEEGVQTLLQVARIWWGGQRRGPL